MSTNGNAKVQTSVSTKPETYVEFEEERTPAAPTSYSPDIQTNQVSAEEVALLRLREVHQSVCSHWYRAQYPGPVRQMTDLQLIDSHGMIVGRVRKVITTKTGDIRSLVIAVDEGPLRTSLNNRESRMR